MQRLCDEQPHHFVTFDKCAHGGERPKATSLWVNDDWLDELAIRCDGGHPHKPWTTTTKGGKIRFATAEEAAYPFLLCERIVNCVRNQALLRGAHAPSSLTEQLEGPTKDRLNRIVLGALPRGHKVKPLVAEYGQYITVYANPQNQLPLDSFLATLPKGAKIVSRRLVTRGDVDAAARDGAENTKFLDIAQMDKVEKVHVGVPSDPDEFVQKGSDSWASPKLGRPGRQTHARCFEVQFYGSTSRIGQETS